MSATKAGDAMLFYSDNAAPAHPAVLEAISAANAVDTAYDGDALTAALDARFSALFETPCTAMWVSSGTAANALALAAICPPHRGVICHEMAHIQNDEAGAPEFYMLGGKLLLARGTGAKLTTDDIAARLAFIPGDIHRVQAAAISIANATEYGQSYTPDEVAAIGVLARARGLKFHIDGARFANAVVHTGASPADLTWRGGVDVLSFGFVKNGGLCAEALVFFDPSLAADTFIRRKRAGLLLSKGRFLAAQILALLDADRWLENARAANAGAARIAAAAGARLCYPVEANEVFLRVSAGDKAALRAKGFGFYDWLPGQVRLVVSWQQPDHEVDALVAAIAALPSPPAI
jgi:threonine aldolase